MNSREDFAGGAVLGFDYHLPFAAAPFALGLSFTTSNNFSDITVLEPAALFRWYFLGKGHSGFFVQADAGAHLLMGDEETEARFMGGLRGGYRLPIGLSFYLEPYGRIGYPFMFGVGIVAGMRFLESK